MLYVVNCRCWAPLRPFCYNCRSPLLDQVHVEGLTVKGEVALGLGCFGSGAGLSLFFIVHIIRRGMFKL